MRKCLLICCLFCVLHTGCRKDPDVMDSVFIETGVHISYVNKAGVDLLDPATPNMIGDDDVTIYYLQDGVKTRVFYSNYDLPENFRIDQMWNNRYFLTVFASTYYDNNNISTTYINVNNRFEDTITTQLNRAGSSISVEKTWVNGQLMWQSSKMTMDSITIVRQ